VSLSWRDHTSVFIGADAVQVARHPGGFARRTPEVVRAPVAPGGNVAQTVGAALREALGRPRARRSDAIVVVSNHYVRFALVPDASKLRNDSERELAARHTLQSIYGEAAASWRVVLDGAGKGSAIAAGIDAALVDAIVGTLTAANLRARALRPLFASALNAARHALGAGPAWFGVAEPGRLALAYVERGAWQSLRSHRLRRSLEQELPVLLEQDRLTGLVRGGTEANGRVVLASSDALRVELPGGAWTVQPVQVELAGRV
jgi:hypothetical protein